MSSVTFDLDKLIEIQARSADEVNEAWLRIMEPFHKLGKRELEAAKVILANKDKGRPEWKMLLQQEMGVSRIYAAVLLCDLRKKRFLDEDWHINRKFSVNTDKGGCNILIRINGEGRKGKGGA